MPYEDSTPRQLIRTILRSAFLCMLAGWCGRGRVRPMIGPWDARHASSELGLFALAQ
jgi:hypothetical protein